MYTVAMVFLYMLLYLPRQHMASTSLLINVLMESVARVGQYTREPAEPFILLRVCFVQLNRQMVYKKHCQECKYKLSA